MTPDPEAAARQARVRFGAGLLEPLTDPLLAIEANGGVAVVVAQLGERGIAGAYLVRRRQPFVLVNGSTSLVRCRFTLAHEYGHHCLRHGQVIDGRIGLDSQRREEVEANRFAAELLLPLEALERWLDRHDEPPPGMEVLVRLGHEFGVSAEVVRHRLQAAGRIDSRRQLRVLDESIAGGRHREVARSLRLSRRLETLALARRRRLRLPARTERILVEAVRTGLLAPEQASLRLGRPADEVRRLADADGERA